LSVFCGLLLLNLPLSAQPTIFLKAKSDFYNIGREVVYLTDESHRLDFAQVKQKLSRFRFSKQDAPNFGYSTAAHWFAFKVKNQVPNEIWLFQVGHPLVDSVSVYFILPNGNIIAKHSGGLLPYATRDYAHPSYIFRIPLESSDEITVFVHCRGNNAKQYPLRVFTEKYYVEQSHDENSLIGTYAGIFIAMIAYNFFIFLSLRERSYLYYTLFMGGFLLLQLSLRGYLHQFTPIGWEHFANLSNLFFVGFTTFVSNRFAVFFLQIRQLLPWVHRVIHVLDIAGIVLMSGSLAALLFPVLLYFLPRLASVTAFSAVILLLPSGIYLWWRGFRPARFYVLAWAALFIGILGYVLRNTGVLPNNLFTTYAILFGSVAEALLLSLGLADRINIFQNEKRQAQAREIKALQEKESLILEQNKTLETKVTERTQEITDKNKELEKQNIKITQQKEEISSQRDALESQSQALSRTFQELTTRTGEIISSLTYAQRIQSALLPREEEIKKLLPESFVFFQPRDIVSGDFYWCEEIEGNILLAAIDCTGHGVPGAFMSMLGHSALSEIVLHQKIVELDLILSMMNKQIEQILKQNHTQLRDGMDVALVAINQRAKEIAFAGAHNAIVFIQEGVLSQIKGDKMSIGGHQFDKKFHKHLIHYKDNPITFYLFSDGYADQFGGERGKKFMIRQFRQVLLDIHSQPMDLQCTYLVELFQNWMQGINIQNTKAEKDVSYRQIDDVLVMGVRLS
jgi:serine phosphatase RsbU (regulator of sigma subunit)